MNRHGNHHHIELNIRKLTVHRIEECGHEDDNLYNIAWIIRKLAVYKIEEYG